MQIYQKLYHLHWCVSKVSSSGNFKKSTVCNINPKQFSYMSRLKSVMLFFLLHFRCFQKLLEKFQKKIVAAIKIFMPMPRLPNGRYFTLMKSCYSKRHIKIHGPQPCRPPYCFAKNKYFWSKNMTCL